MKTFYEQIPLDSSRSFIVREFVTNSLNYPFHHHPFFEINYVINGTGKRIVGQNITEFKNCDLSLIAPNLPHQFLDVESVKSEKFHSIIIQFHPKIFGEEFIKKTEIVSLNSLLQKAKRGITFGATTIKKVDSKLKRLLHSTEFMSVLLFLEILHDLAQSIDFNYLSEIDWEANISGKGKELTDRVFQYIFDHFTEEISLEQVAGVAGISKSAFSHFFKKRTGKTYSLFINELRISHSIKLLNNTEKSIAEICFESGFNNLSYFNRVFKNNQKLSPKEYRRKYAIL